MEFEKLMAKVMAETKKQLEDVFYEIEYDACPMPGVGKFVPKSRKVEKYTKAYDVEVPEINPFLILVLQVK